MGIPGAPTDASPLVMVADDDEQVCEYMARALREAGYQVLVANDGLAAWGVVEGRAGALHLVVTDVTMPGLTGTQLAARIKQRFPRLPVLYVTGRELPPDAPDAPRLHKPFTPDVLAAHAHALIAGRYSSAGEAVPDRSSS
jgi:CheY-like chemotaxis protein